MSWLLRKGTHAAGWIGILLLPVVLAAAVAVILTVAVTFVSLRLGIHFYKKRRNGGYDK